MLEGYFNVNMLKANQQFLVEASQRAFVAEH